MMVTKKKTKKYSVRQTHVQKIIIIIMVGKYSMINRNEKQKSFFFHCLIFKYILLFVLQTICSLKQQH